MNSLGIGMLAKVNINTKKTKIIPPLTSTVPPGLTSVSTNKGILISPTVICMKISNCQMINVHKTKVLYAFFFVCDTYDGSMVPFAIRIAAVSSIKRDVGRRIAFVMSIPRIKL